MAVLLTNTRLIKLKDGDSLKDICLQLGVPFGCESGICGTCMVEVLSGAENLSEMSEAEQSMELPPKTRLACQCKIKKGTVKINVE